MRSEIKIILLVIGVVLICCIGFGAYMVYDNMQEQNEKLNESLQQVQVELNESKNNTTASNSSSNSGSSSSTGSTKKVSSSSSSSSSSSGSSGSKVTYEEAGVDKDIGYIKTCKYKGCGARYNSKLSYCPSCGHRNIYV